MILAGLFLFFLLIFARGTGLRAIISFIDTILLIWKVLVPCLLNGFNPVLVSFGLVLALTALILMLIYGWDRRFLSAVSGVIMDLSVDICSAVYEVVQKKTDIRAREAIASGFAVGRAACGSTTTTLLLAYSGSYVALFMVFMAQGTPVEVMLNYKYVAAEIVHTIVGSFGLVTVAPLTAITSGFLLIRGKKEAEK